MAKLKLQLARFGLLIEYDRDLAGLDIGLHLYDRGQDGQTRASSLRVWMQAKGKKTSTLSANQFDILLSVGISNLPVDMVRYWYGAPEPVYLVLYVESVDEFLADDIRDLVDAAGGAPYLASLGNQGTMTINIPKSSTLQSALARMPRHRSMRIDGPSWRGRPLGHRYDPLRSEMHPLSPDDFKGLVQGLLAAHDFRLSEVTEPPAWEESSPALFGRLMQSYEWVLPFLTEIGYGPESEFRIEGEALRAQGNVLIIVDSGASHPQEWPRLQEIIAEAQKRGITQALVFLNIPEGSAEFGRWRQAVAPLDCWPQALGSLSFNVLVTTNVYLEYLDRLQWKFVNHL